MKSLGRFISEDPIGFGGGDANLYRYAENGPANFGDPMGLFSDGFFSKGLDFGGFNFGNDINFELNPDFSFDSGFENSIQFGSPCHRNLNIWS